MTYIPGEQDAKRGHSDITDDGVVLESTTMERERERVSEREDREREK